MQISEAFKLIVSALSLYARRAHGPDGLLAAIGSAERDVSAAIHNSVQHSTDEDVIAALDRLHKLDADRRDLEGRVSAAYLAAIELIARDFNGTWTHPKLDDPIDVNCLGIEREVARRVNLATLRGMIEGWETIAEKAREVTP